MLNDTEHYDKCQMMYRSLKLRHERRIILYFVFFFLNLCMHVSNTAVDAVAKLFFQSDMSTVLGRSEYSDLIDLLVLLYCIGNFFLLLMGEPKNPKFLIFGGLILILGMILRLIALFCGLPVFILCLAEIPDCKKALWLKEQEGYPYFNERFHRQMQKKEEVYTIPKKFIEPVPENQVMSEIEVPDIPKGDESSCL